ncbi:LD-carboxypeptidase [Candidatus Woesearchaeota archaeon]|nr:LD-carboxypeptidase [Candidatus Woesearchaeota archaeon]
MFPQKLRKGDVVRVVAPARSLAVISPELRMIAEQRFKEIGLEITYGKHVEEKDEFASSSIKSRVEDIHESFADSKVRMVISAIGGFNSHQLLPYLDFALIRKNPKIFCGYSDITALENGIYARTGLVTYSSPAFSTFGMQKGFDYTMTYFMKCLFSDALIKIIPGLEWSDDSWYKDQENRVFVRNSGMYVIQEGEAEGTIIGGNMGTLRLLQGTPYMPSLRDSILFIEDDEEDKSQHIDRSITGLSQHPEFRQVKAIVIGRFQKASEMTKEKLTKIIKSNPALKHIPVIADVDFGHTSPMITFPVGGRAKLTVRNGIKLEILSH